MTVHDEQERARLAAEAAARGLQEWQLDAMRGAPASVMRDVVADSRRGISQSASMIPDRLRPSEPPRAPNSSETPIAPPPGVDHCDRIAEAFARQDLTVTMQQKLEIEWIEKLLDRRNGGHRAKTEYDPYSRQRMGFDDDE
jgi:hypothetical protein